MHVIRTGSQVANDVVGNRYLFCLLGRTFRIILSCQNYMISN